MTNKQNFIKGTMILMCANAISKILGAVFKIPLTYLLKEEGMAIYNTAFNVYVMVLSFIISGVPLAISKMVAEENALSNQSNVRKIITVSSLVFGGLGLLGSAVLWFGADFFSFAMKEPKGVFCLKIIAPAIFFVVLGAIYKSFYQGISNMIPTAISQVIEAVIRLVAGYGLAVYYSSLTTEYTAAAAIMGVTVGEIIATFILFVLYLPKRFSLPSKGADKTTKSILLSISQIALPTIAASAILNAMDLVDITVIRRSLENILFTPETARAFLLKYSSYTSLFDNLTETLKISPDGSRWLYGAYSGYALTVFHLPIGILGTLGVSILPVIASSLALNNRGRANSCILLAIKFTLLIALPAAFLITFFSEPILEILFHNTASACMLTLLSPCLVFISLIQILNTVSNAGGQIITPFIFAFFGIIVKLISSYVLIRNPYFNVNGIVISANVSYFIVMVMSYISVKRRFSLSSRITKTLIKPLISSILMITVMRTVYLPFTIIFPNTLISFFMSLFIGIIVYILMLIFTKCISEKDFALLKERN